MPYELFLALRYLRSRNRRRLARVTAAAAVLGIAVGVASLVVAFALSNGFRDEMRNKILQGTAHLSVLRSDNVPIADYSSLRASIAGVKGVRSVFETTYDGALSSGQQGSSYSVIRGLDGDTAPRTWLQQGSFDPLFDSSPNQTTPNAVVGAELAARLGLRVNDVFQVVPANASNQPRRLKVAGVFRSGLYEYDSTWVYVSLLTANAYASGNHAASVLSVQVDNIDDVKTIASQITGKLGPHYTIVDWQQANQPLFAALSLERRMALFTIGMIIAIAVINITTMLTLVVVERRRDIAVLNALGATRTSLTILFVIEGGIVGSIGAIVGAVLGVVVCLIGNHYKLVSLPADVYSISNVPFNTHLSEVLFATVLAFLLSIIATIYPSRTAAKLRPIETLKDI